MALSPDKKALVLGFENGEMRLLDTAGWSTIRTLRGHTDRVECVIFSKAGNRIVSGSKDSSIRVWSLQEETDSFALQGHTDEVTSVAFSPNELQLVSGSKDMTARVWDLDSKSFIFVLTGHTDEVRAVAWSPDGQQIASGSMDETIRLWEASSGSHEMELSLGSRKAWSLLYIPGSQRLIAGTDGDIIIWDLDTENDPIILEGHNSDIRSLEISADSQWILSASDDRTANIWSEETGEPVHTFSGHSKVALGAAFLNDREAISLGGDETGVKSVTALSYSPCGRWLATGDSGGVVKIWDLMSGAEVCTLEGHTKYIKGVIVAAEGLQLVSYVIDCTARVWDMSDDMCKAAHVETLDIDAGALVFSPRGTMLAWSDSLYFGESEDDDEALKEGAQSDIHLWDVKSGQELFALKGHRGPPACFPWSSQGILSGGLDSTVRLLKSQLVDSTSTWTCVAVIRVTMGPNPVVPLEFASGDILSSLYVWKMTEEGGGEVDVRLKWGSTYRLVATGAKIKDAIGLDDMHRMLLQQRGAIDEKSLDSTAAAGVKEGESENSESQT
ncbi:hypothetical protein BGZ54_002037 [Gamsiella multidivaricata]|nr:hypothetical protein BGZ54_002037 [Gamsiella multidivaricata]